MYKIDKGIKPPSRSTIYPFTEMEIGDSFLVETESESYEKVRGRLASACTRKGLEDKKFTIRIVDNGLRCWRIK